MNFFIYDERLGILIPHIQRDWDDLSRQEQEEILFEWEKIRESIPDRIKQLEKEITKLQHQLDHEDNFLKSCVLNAEISELASVINDLQIWYRTNQDVTAEKSHA